MLRNARVIDQEDVDTEIVTVGSKVRLKDLERGEEYEYTLVGSAEADPASMRISNESPVGRAVIGKKVGEVVEVEGPPAPSSTRSSRSPAKSVVRRKKEALLWTTCKAPMRTAPKSPPIPTNFKSSTIRWPCAARSWSG